MQKLSNLENYQSSSANVEVEYYDSSIESRLEYVRNEIMCDSTDNKT